MYKVWDDKKGVEVHEGDEVVDFRGETATFLRVTRGYEPGKSAKVSPCP